MLHFTRTSLFIVLAGVLGYGIAVAQFTALDPVRTAPHIYENVFENDRLRVLKVTERNGETAPLHAHPDRLLVYLSPCAWMETADDGNRHMQSFKLGNVRWEKRVTHGGETSGVVQECSRLDIELK